MSSSGYVTYPIDSNTQDLLDAAYTFLKTKVPSWQENDGNLDTWILQLMAQQVSDLLGIAQDVPDTIFMYYGSQLMGIPPLDATPAIVGSTWTMVDNGGHIILAGTQVAIEDDVGEQHAFQTSADIVIPAGQTATAAGAVTLTSVETGQAISDLGGNGYVASLIDTLSFVQSVVLTGTSAGGQDAELTSEYLDRLVRKLQRLSNRPVLASDFALASLDVAGVYRTVALDGYNPADSSYNNERMVAVASVDDNGQPIPAGVKTSLQTYLDGQREINFVVNVFDPTVTQVDVTCTVMSLASYMNPTVQANVVESLNSYLASTNWGKDPAVTDATASAQTWVSTPIVHLNKIIQVIAATEGVDYVVSCSIAIHGGAAGSPDITLPGAAPLTSPGTMTVTATH